jgi:hypothetical protein
MLCWTPGTAMVGLVPWPDNGPVHTVHNALLGLYEYANSLPEDARRPMPANDAVVLRPTSTGTQTYAKWLIEPKTPAAVRSSKTSRGDATVKGRKWSVR